MQQRLKFFPITIYAIVMGLSGLTMVFHRFSDLGILPYGFYYGGIAVISLLFLLFTAVYALKAIKHFGQVRIDFRHPIRINFFSAVSISLLLLATAWHPLSAGVAKPLWFFGMALHSFLMLHTISFWIEQNFEIHSMNPAWFIPVVGNIIIPVVGVEFMPPMFNLFFYAVGIFFWLVLFTIFLNRVVFHHQMPQKFMPTLFILIAPPAVGFIAYYRITGMYDTFAQMLLLLTYFFLLLILFLWKNFFKIGFYLSWWAFTFPLTAATLATVLALNITGHGFYRVLAYFLLVVSVSVIALVTIKTVGQVVQGKICVNEDIPKPEASADKEPVTQNR